MIDIDKHGFPQGEIAMQKVAQSEVLSIKNGTSPMMVETGTVPLLHDSSFASHHLDDDAHGASPYQILAIDDYDPLKDIFNSDGMEVEPTFHADSMTTVFAKVDNGFIQVRCFFVCVRGVRERRCLLWYVFIG